VKIVDKEITLTELQQMAQKIFGVLVKAVVDIKKGVMVVDAELHSDQEELLLDNKSNQEDLWGINLYPEKFGAPEWIEFDSMINLRPWQGNKSRGVDNSKVQEIIRDVVTKLVKP